MMRNCNYCERLYQAVRPQSKYCSTNCRVRQSRSAPLQAPPVAVPSRKKAAGQAAKSIKKAPTSIDPAPISQPLEQPGDSPLVIAVRAELEAANVADSVLGQMVLTLAMQMSGRETAGGMSSLSKEFSRVRAEALRSAAPLTVDPLDELQARREAKLAAG